MSRRFVLTLHSHLPWVLHHGRWPHGSDWICEAAIDTYLPLLAALQRLEADAIPAPLTLGVTPVLAAQLADPAFRHELDLYFEQRLRAIDETDVALTDDPADTALRPLLPFWRDRLRHLRRLWHEIGGDLIGAFRRLADAGRIELISSAATHGFLPLLGRDESIRLQLLVGRNEHIRHFGVPPRGCWAPECAYRPRGPWAPLPDAPRAGDIRRGIEEHLAHVGYRWFVVDAHLARAGVPADPYDPDGVIPIRGGDNSPYRVYEVGGSTRGRPVRIVVRDPVTSAQIWNRHGGYPGDGRYLEFHKLRQGGLRFWAVTDPRADLADKHTYDPEQAQRALREHARHFVEELAAFDRTAAPEDGAIVAPFDTELFGHWWFEGVDFLEELFRRLHLRPTPHPATGGDFVRETLHPEHLLLQEGTWGANGDFSMWLNPETAWTWERLWPLEERFWNLVSQAFRRAEALPLLAQAGRELLLAQSSDWQFIISTGAAGDYATERFIAHCTALSALLDALESPEGDLTAATHLAESLERIDGLFPEMIGAIGAAADLVPER